MGSVVLMNRRSLLQSVQTVEYLQRIFIGQFLVAVVTQSRMAKYVWSSQMGPRQ